MVPLPCAQTTATGTCQFQGLADAGRKSGGTAEKYQAIPNKSERLGASSMKSMEQTEAEKVMETRNFWIDRAQNSSGAQHAVISPQSNNRWHRRDKQQTYRKVQRETYGRQEGKP